MKRAASFAAFLERLAAASVPVEQHDAPGLSPARLIAVASGDWARLAHEARACSARWVAGWGEDAGETLAVNACFEMSGGYVVARTSVARTQPSLPSQAPSYPGAERPERHTRDLLGIDFSGYGEPRRWTRHRAWSAHEHPLRREFPAAGRANGATPPDSDYKFLHALGSGVYEIPVGPVHAGIIEPGHFRFQAVGETVLNLEERLGYVHKGIEKIAEGRDAVALARLAGRVSGDSTVAHAWAACMAMEKAGGVAVPARAAWLRALACERERIANHLGDVGAILNDIAFAFGFYQFTRLREDWLRRSHEALGHRFMMDLVVPGGVALEPPAATLAAMREDNRSLRSELVKLMAIVNDLPSVKDRLATTGVLEPAHAKAFGCTGFVGRASEVDFDVRRDAPYAPYDKLTTKVPVYRYGDVAARMRVRVEEIHAALDLVDDIVDLLPAGDIRAAFPVPAAGAEGLAAIEGWRGEIVTFVRFGADGRIARFFPRDPSWTTWPALEVLIHDNIVPDFPVCNKSVNASYSGHDL